MMVRKIILALILTLALPVSGQQVDVADCDDPQSQAEMNACAFIQFQIPDAELNREWNSLRARLKEAEEMPDYEGWFQKALEGQRGWLAYRDGQCAAEGYAARGDSMEAMQPLSLSSNDRFCRIGPAVLIGKSAPDERAIKNEAAVWR